MHILFFLRAALLALLVGRLAHADDTAVNPSLPASLSFLRSPEVMAPQTDLAFAIDGTCSPEERAACAQIRQAVTFVSAARADDRMTVYVAHTGSQLYVGFTIRRIYATPPRALAEKRDDGRLWKSDDSFEMRLLTETQGFDYIGNSAGMIGDASGEGWRNKSHSWNDATLKYAASTTENGWQGEFLIDAKTLGLASFGEESQQFLVDFFNNSKSDVRLGGWAYLGGAWNSGYADFPRLRFGGADTLHQGEIQLGELGDDRCGWSATIRNPTATERPAEIWAAFYRLRPGEQARNFFEELEGVLSPEGIAIIPGASRDELIAFAFKDVQKRYVLAEQIQEDLTLAAGMDATYTLRKPALPGDYIVAWRLADGDRIVSAGAYPFDIAEPLQTGFEYHYLVGRAIIVSTSVTDAIAQQSDRLQFRFERDGKTVHEETVAGVTGGIARTKFATGDWPAGDYTLHTAALSGDRVISESTSTFRKPEPPFWWGSDAGTSIAVPWPWTPVQANATTTSVWGRDISWAEGVVPSAITSQGRSLLARPPSLTAIVDGKSYLAIWKSFALAETRPEAAVYRGVAEVGAVTIAATTTIEFDGMMRFDWTLSGTADAKLESLILELPVAPEVAELVHSHDVSGAAPKSTTPMKFVPTIAIRNSHVGLEWFAECQQDWSNRDEERLLELVPAADALALRVHFVDKPVRLTESRTITWGLSAWPVKPWPEQPVNFSNYLGKPKGATATWDEWADGIPLATKHHLNIVEWFHWNANGKIGDYPVIYTDERRVEVKRAASIAAANGIPIAGHTAYAMPTDVEDWEYYGMEMVLHPLANKGEYGYLFTATPAYADAYVARYKMLAQETGWSGLQSDGGLDPRYATNIEAGYGWYDEKGTLRGRWPIFAYRELAKRLYNVFHGEVNFPGLPRGYGHITLHNHGPFGAVTGFADSIHLGEGRESWGSFHTMDLDEQRARYQTRSFGVPVLLLPKPGKVDNGGRGRIAFALLLQMNPMSNRLLMHLDEENYLKASLPVHRVWAAQDWVKAGPDSFRGTWENADLISYSQAGVYSSIHLRPGKALVAVINWQPDDRTVDVTLKLDAMGLKASGLQIEDAITGEAVETDGGHLQLLIGGDGYRLLKVLQK